jgi:WD40 repeat protein
MTVWDAVNRTDLITFPVRFGTEPCSLALSPDGSLVAAGSGNYRDDTEKIAGRGGSVRTWDLRTGKERAVTPPNGEWVYGKARFSPDGKMLVVTASSLDGTRSQDMIVDVKQAILTKALPQPIGTVVVSPDGRRLAYGGSLLTSIYDVASGEARNLTDNYTLPTFRPDGNRLAVFKQQNARTELVLLDARTGVAQNRVALPNNGRPEGILFSPDGGRLATMHPNEVLVWDAGRLEVLSVLKLETPVKPSDAVFSADGKMLALPGAAGTVRIWDAQTGLVRLTFFPLEGERVTNRIQFWFSSDWRRFVQYVSRGGVRVWDLPAVD